MLTISPNLKDFPRYDLHVLAEGYRLGFERGINGLTDPEAEILERDGHLGRFARVKIGSKLMARDASRPFYLQYALCGHASLGPFVDGLIANSQQISELLDAADFINCCLDT